MKALCRQGKKDIRRERVPESIIEDLKDAIVQVTSRAIRGSDLHLTMAQSSLPSQGRLERYSAQRS